jgi:hypothetical protein
VDGTMREGRPDSLQVTDGPIGALEVVPLLERRD